MAKRKKSSKRKVARRKRRSPDELLTDLEARLEELQGRVQGERRFSPEAVRAERERLELSAADYGRLVGVSAMTIYGWEKGRSKPRLGRLHSWLEVRGIGKREAWRRLGY